MFTYTHAFQPCSLYTCVCCLYAKLILCLLYYKLPRVGYHRFCPQHETELRERVAKLNPISIPKDGQGPPVYTNADEPAPRAKTDAIQRAAAQESDAASTAGIKRKHPTHPSMETGVHASHALMKVPGWNEQKSRKPDGMHVTTGEVKAVTVMLGGGTADKYSREQLHLLADWKFKYNSRWGDLLAPYRAGMFANLHVLHSNILVKHTC